MKSEGDIMSIYEQKRAAQLEQVQRLEQFVAAHFPNASYRETLTQLMEDLQTNESFITVLGEFKRGKSTLLNALLQSELLPSDVTPTTAAIHVIRHSEDHYLEVHYTSSSEVERMQLEGTRLKEFTFDANRDLNEVHHIGVRLPMPKLLAHSVLIDTPGVGDLNEHRLDVTYKYIPRSELILFVLDATAPLRKSELTYLTDTVLKLKFGDVIFVGNFTDRLDEEELEETLEYMRKKLQKLIPEEKIVLLPISAKLGLEDPENPQLQELIQVINQNLKQGTGSEKKLQFFERRLQVLLDEARQDVDRVEQLRAASLAELELAKSQLNRFEQDKVHYEDGLKQYLQQRQTEISEMTQKSVDYLFRELSGRVRDTIELYEGPKLDSYVEKQVPYMVKSQVRAWVNQYLPKVDILLLKLQREVSRGLSKLCQQQLDVFPTRYSDSEGLQIGDVEFSLSHQTMDPALKTGLLVGGAAVLVTLLSGGLLVPVLSMAGLPFLNKKMAEKKLEETKQAILPQVDDEIRRVTDELGQSMVQMIADEIAHMKKRALLQLEEYVRSYERSLETEIQQRQTTPHQGVPHITMDDFERTITA